MKATRTLDDLPVPTRTMSLRELKTADPEAYAEYRRTVSLRHYYRHREQYLATKQDERNARGLKRIAKFTTQEQKLAAKERYRLKQREYWNRPENRERYNAMRRARRAANPQKVTEQNARWRAAHPEWASAFNRLNQSRRRAARLSAASVNVTVAQVEARFAMWAGRCWVCAGPGTQIDHVKPISRGGPHILANLRPICARCNKRKGNRWPLSESWIAAQVLSRAIETSQSDNY